LDSLDLDESSEETHGAETTEQAEPIELQDLESTADLTQI
jgi:hypothetical protein